MKCFIFITVPDHPSDHHQETVIHHTCTYTCTCNKASNSYDTSTCRWSESGGMSSDYDITIPGMLTKVARLFFLQWGVAVWR